MGILAASGQIKSSSLDNHLFCGALQLDGRIEQTKNAFNILESASLCGLNKVVILLRVQSQSEFEIFLRLKLST